MRWADRKFSDDGGRVAFAMYEEKTNSFILKYESKWDQVTRERLRFHTQEAAEHAMKTWCEDGALVGLPSGQGTPIGSILDWAVS